MIQMSSATVEVVVRRLIMTAAVASALMSARPASAQTREFLDAPVVKSQIRVQWDAANKKFVYAIDNDDTFRDLKVNTLFLTKTSIFVTYYKINPLQFNASASISTADDPAHGVVTKLLTGLLSVASTIGVGPAAESAAASAAASATTAAAPFAAPAGAADLSGKPATPSGCTALDNAYLFIKQLDDAIYGDATKPAAVKKTVTTWIDAIDKGYKGSDGMSAIADGAKAIGDFVDGLDKTIATASDLITKLDAAAAAPAGLGPCNAAAKNAYVLAHMTNPRARLDQLKAIKAAAAKLKDSLSSDFVNDSSKWIKGVNYKVSAEITPTPEKLQNVVLKAVKVTTKVDDTSGSLSVSDEDAGSIAITVRKYSPLAPEIGTGAVFGFIKAPKYGTSTNAAGKTVVAKEADNDVSINPSVLVNFACRCEMGPFVTPMFQIGAATSKDVPAILIGGGLRLFGFGKGDFAIGAGRMIGWVKDLTDLKEGDVISGTKDIDEHMKFSNKPRNDWYIVIQYKF